ncbi:hypothetical protein, partial [Oceanithermus sp.]
MRKVTFLLAVLVLLLAACSGNRGTEVTVRAENSFGQPDPILAVAYQVGDGDWQRAWPDQEGVYRFYVPAGEDRYGVTVRCGDFIGLGAFGSAVTYMLTTADTTEPLLACPTVGRFATVKGHADASALAGAHEVGVYSNFTGTTSGGTAFDYTIMVPEGETDLVVIAHDGVSTDPDHLVGGKVFRGVEAVGVTNRDLSLSATDTVTSNAFHAFTVPAGWSGSYQVSLITSGGGALSGDSLGRGSEAGGAYRLLKGLTATDTLIVTAGADNGADRSVGVLRYVPADGAGEIEVDLRMTPFPSGYAVDAAALPTFELNNPSSDLDGYFLYAYWEVVFWSHMISDSWIEDRG